MTARTLTLFAPLLLGLALGPTAVLGAKPANKPATSPAKAEACKPEAGKAGADKAKRKNGKSGQAEPNCPGAVKAVTGPARVKGSGFFGGAAVPLLGLGGAGGGIAATVASSTSDSPASP